MSAECSAGNIPPGYKQTEVGIIPEDWEMKLLEEIADVIDPHPSHRAPPEVTNGIPFVGIGDLNDNGDIIGNKIRTVDLSVFEEHQKRYDLEEELIGLGRVASIGKVVKIKFSGNRYTISPTLGVIRGTKVKRDYLLHALKSKATADQFNKIMSGSTRSSVGMIVLRKLEIILPPTKSEQESIAEALSDTDALIESLEQLISKKRQIKQGAMQELLTGKRRLPGFEIKNGYKHTEIGVIPEDWSLQPLGELVMFLDGKRRPVKDADRAKMRGSIPYYGASGIVDYVNDYLFDEDLILLGEDGENILSRACHLAFCISGKAWVNNHAHVLRPNPDISIGFLTDYLESLNYERFNSGTAQPKLNKQTCFGILIALPPTKTEQTAIASILSNMDSEITALEEKLAKARQIKQGMMQELLTGRIRLV